MKSVELFEKFLTDTVNLNRSRLDVARTGVDSVTKFLNGSDVTRDYFIEISPQGSYRQKTIIRPPSSEFEFDVDLLFKMKHIENWEPSEYLDIVAKAFKESSRYRDIVDRRGKSRCITLDYESDFHIDVVPAVEFSGSTYIMNRKTNEFEASDGDGYALWFEQKGQLTRGHLSMVIRLLKYLRDARAQFEIKSILLTTLIGRQINTSDVSSHFADVPTALLTLLTRLDSYLQANWQLSTVDVSNPVLPSETFDRHWNQKKYSDFRAGVHDLLLATSRAYAESDQKRSDSQWQEIFGDEFPRTTPKSTQIAPVSRDAGEEFLADYGISENLQFQLRIDAHVKQDGWRPFLLRRFKGLLYKLRSLEFRIISCNVPEPYTIKWKVKNYGEEAKNDLRGKIIEDDGTGRRKENTKYRGKHFVECYAIKKGVCVAKDHLDVAIGFQ